MNCQLATFDFTQVNTKNSIQSQQNCDIKNKNVHKQADVKPTINQIRTQIFAAQKIIWSQFKTTEKTIDPGSSELIQVNRNKALPASNRLTERSINARQDGTESTQA